MRDIFVTVTDELNKNMKIEIESYIRLRIKPCPSWMPKKLWLFLASKFIFLEKLTL